MNVEKIREMYPEGTQIILQEMRGESQMPYGLKGSYVVFCPGEPL